MLIRHLTGKKDARSLFYLAQQYRDGSQWQKAIDTLGEYMKISKFGDEKNLGKYYLRQSYFSLGDTDNAIKSLDSDIAEHHYYKGFIYYKDKQYDKAIAEMLRALQLGSSQGSFSPIADIESRAYDTLSMCFHHYGRNELAYSTAISSLGYRENKRVRNNLKYFK